LYHPLVSIIIPTYNRIEYLKKAVDSALSQTYPNTEILICDDCSTDGTEQYVSETLLKHPDKLRYVRHPKNLGFVKNHHKAIFELAKGDLFFILGDDDELVNPEYFTEVVSFLEKNPEIGVVGTAHTIDFLATGKRIKVRGEQKQYPDFAAYLHDRMSPHNLFFIGATVVKREIALKTGAFRFNASTSDVDYIERCIILSPAAHLPIKSITYRIHPANYSKNASSYRSIIRNIELNGRTCRFALANDVPGQTVSRFRQKFWWGFWKSLIGGYIAELRGKIQP